MFSLDTCSTKVSTIYLIFWQNPNNKESAESRWKPDMQGRGGRSGRVNLAPRHMSHGEKLFQTKTYFRIIEWNTFWLTPF